MAGVLEPALASRYALSELPEVLVSPTVTETYAGLLLILPFRWLALAT